MDGIVPFIRSSNQWVQGIDRGEIVPLTINEGVYSVDLNLSVSYSKL